MDDRATPSVPQVAACGQPAGPDRRNGCDAADDDDDAADVTILMAVWNGARCLDAQLDSFAAQAHRRWQLVVSDDGSTDDSRGIVAGFAGRMAAAGNAVHILDGPRAGDPAPNFMFLLRAARDLAAPGGWIAFADQDDVWLQDRLSRGIASLRGAVAGGGAAPMLYCSRTWITDAALSGRRLSAPRPRPAGFANALVQNIAAGNTILLEPAAARLAMAAADEPAAVVMHDWWLYQIVTGAGGAVLHDDRPTLLYRQHDVNRVGANDTGLARLRRVTMILRGVYRRWNDVNVDALTASVHRLTPANRATLAAFDDMRRARRPWTRLRRLRRLRLYRQSRASTAALWAAAALRLL